MFCQFLLRRKMNQLYVYTCVCAKSLQSCPILRFYGLQPARLLCSWDSPGKNTGVGCHVLLQMIFLGCNPGIKPMSFMSPTLAGGFFTTSTTWEAICIRISPPSGISFPFRSPQSILMGTLLRSFLSYIIGYN